MSFRACALHHLTLYHARVIMGVEREEDMMDVIENRNDDTTYNGWTNWETWNVALWIDNEPAQFNYWHERAERTLASAFNGSREAAVEDTAELLKHYDLVFCDFTDVKRDAIDRVNWREVAEGLIATVEDYHLHGDTFLKGGE